MIIHNNDKYIQYDGKFRYVSYESPIQKLTTHADGHITITSTNHDAICQELGKHKDLLSAVVRIQDDSNNKNDKYDVYEFAGKIIDSDYDSKYPEILHIDAQNIKIKKNGELLKNQELSLENAQLAIIDTNKYLKFSSRTYYGDIYCAFGCLSACCALMGILLGIGLGPEIGSAFGVPPVLCFALTFIAMKTCRRPEERDYPYTSVDSLEASNKSHGVV
ncbi:hypothetical protein [Wolbachia endosymbiont of Ctenocephalides felis wCfeT]|uniref:hypothetical protein n=1 Tax=Wolbachia endosymbiont of Ctenocephalides felis wCfeT TaxID=2732593 RepID=UPI0014482DB2|nr:hypothetical protein [Wolbachia endosymbiont of Ctenocephalides felis wCfeT]